MPVYTNPLIDQEPTSKAVFYVDNKCAIFTCNGSPEGVILANTGSIAISDNGSIFKKTTDDVNTGWIELSPISTANVAVTIQRDVTAVGNVGAGLDPLHTYTLDTPNRLLVDGDYLKLEYAGFYGANDNNKRITVSFGGQTFLDTPSLDLDGSAINLGWRITARIIRLTATTVRASGSILMQQFAIDSANTALGLGSGGAIHVKDIDLTVADLSANPTVILVSGEGVANNDIVQNLSIIEVIKQ